MGEAQPPVGEELIHPVCAGRFIVPVYQGLLHNLLDKVVLLVDDLLAAGIHHSLGQLHGVFLQDNRVAFQNLHGIPAVVGKLGVFLFQLPFHQVNFVLNPVAVHHGELLVMVVDMAGLAAVVVMNEGRDLGAVPVVNHRVHEHIQAPGASGR